MSQVIIAGGGTGGHLYPGIAIAKALQAQDPNIKIHFVGTEEGLEAKIIPKEGFQLHLIAGGKLNFSGDWHIKLLTLLKLPIGFFQSIRLIRKLKPRFVIGVGGYASGPFVLAAALLKVPSVIWEPNVLPGLANKWLSKFVKKCYLVFEDTAKYLPSAHCVPLGMPIRKEIEEVRDADTNPSLDRSKFHLLHFGGSQGSRAIGKTLCAAIETQKGWTSGMHIVHQTGSTDFRFFTEKYRRFQDLVEVKEYIYNMADYYKWADLVVCRGGAGTISELAAFGLPAIIIPLPAADGHQELNARALVKDGAMKMILQKDLTPARLAKEIEELRRSPAVLQVMRDKVRAFHRPRAAEAIAKDLLSSF